MDYAQYGLTATDATSADHEKGIVAGPNGGFYSIDGFKREKNDGLDTDKGSVFGGALEEAGRAAGFDPTTFNTATDVENALKAIGGGGPEKPRETTFDPKTMEMSPEYAHARARVGQFRENRLSGKDAEALFGGGDAGNFFEEYKLRLGKKNEKGLYLPSDNPEYEEG